MTLLRNIRNIFVIIMEIDYHTLVEFLLTLSIVLIRVSCRLKRFGEDLLKLGEKKTRGQLNACTFFLGGGGTIQFWGGSPAFPPLPPTIGAPRKRCI